MNREKEILLQLLLEKYGTPNNEKPINPIVKNYANAEKTLNKIIKFAKEQGGAYFEAQASYILAKVKVATGDIPAAKALIENAKSIAKATNDKALDEEITQETQGLF